MAKGLFTYTTDVTAAKSVETIEAMLIRTGAVSILKEYNQKGDVSALSFRIKSEFGVLSLRMPARSEDVLLVLRQQAEKGKMPKNWVTHEQANRVAWRVVFHWLEAQLAMIEVGNAKLEQVMLPYVQEPASGKPLYELLDERAFQLNGLTLALPEK